MSANSTLTILQDSKGFMWFGSQFGLNRFDGKNFKIFHKDPDDSNSISDSYIFNLSEDKLGGIWICAGEGLNRYDKVTGKFTRFDISSNPDYEIRISKITVVYCDSDSFVWFGTRNGRIFKLHQNFIGKDDCIEIWLNALKTAPKFSESYISSIIENSEREIWTADIESNLVLILPDDASSQKVKFKKYSSAETGIKGVITCLLEPSTDTNLILAGTNNGIWAFNKLNGKAEKWLNHSVPSAYKKGNVTGIIEAEPGIFWITYEYLGLLIYNLIDGSSMFYRNSPGISGSLSSDNLYTIYKDRSNTIWLGALNGELNKVLFTSSLFKTYSYNPKNKNGLHNSYITAVHEDQNNVLWIGTRGGGIHKGIPIKDKFNNYYYKLQVDEKFNRELDNPYIKTINSDSYGNLWVGTWGSGLYRYSADRKKIIRFKYQPLNSKSILSGIVRAIIEDSKKRLWIGTTSGGFSQLVNYSDDDAKNIYFENYTPENSALNQDDVFAVTETNVNGKSLIWIGTYSNGLNCFDPETKKFLSFRNNRNDKNTIVSDNIRTLFTDSKQNLWIGTVNGLSLLKAEDQKYFKFRSLKKTDGLSDNEIESILEDDEGNFWISTANGITRFDPDKNEFIHFNENEGLPGHEFVLNAAAKCKNGNMIFGAIKGLLQFNPEKIVTAYNPPEIVITSFKVFEEEILQDTSVTEIHEINLKYNQNFFSLEFAALDFRDPSHNKFMYMLEGIHDDWIFSDNRNYISFSHLPPGEYIFKVKGASSSGIWNKEGASLKINIIPPWWMTTWFKIISAVIVLLSGIFLVRYISTRKLKQQIRRMEIDRRIQSERQRISDDLHDNLGSQLSNIITGLEISNHLLLQKENSRIREHISYLENYTRLTMNELRQTIFSLNQNEPGIKNLIEQIEKYIHGLAFKKELIQFKSNIEKDFHLTPLIQLNIFRLFQEALNNALKYSGAEQITVELNIEIKNQLILIVKDNGIGFDPSDESIMEKGNGFRSMQRRAERMHGCLETKAAKNSGTTILLKVTIPEL